MEANDRRVSPPELPEDFAPPLSEGEGLRLKHLLGGLGCCLIFWAVLIWVFRILGISWGWMAILAATGLFVVWAAARR